MVIEERNIGIIKTSENVGFSLVPDQCRRKSIEKGFNLNIMVVGRQGLGTSTLINSIFTSKIIDKRTDELSIYKYDIYENEILLRLTVSTCHKFDNSICEYINLQYSEYLEKETGLTRNYQDNRVHLVIFMLPNDLISKEEIVLMKNIGEICNLLPIISKADTFTAEELEKYKVYVRNVLKENLITYYIPKIQTNDTEIANETEELVNKFPLAVIASEECFEINSEIIRGRKYPWGFVNIETYGDFISLRKLIIYNHFEDIKFICDTVYYNKFRNISQTPEITRERIEKIKEEMMIILKEKRLGEECVGMSLMDISEPKGENLVE
ncbi:Cell division control protein 10 [Dictyocoela muelleri]|nr:Cell division control protein 10 [Dictyocoela muelleri]